MRREIITTSDGSHSLHIPELGEQYHSVHGAVQESRHVFLKHGLNHLLVRCNSSDKRILEVGFGTGLNAFLTALAIQEQESHVPVFSYDALETFPIGKETIDRLNYAEMVTGEKDHCLWSAIHRAAWDQPVSILPHLTLCKQLKKLEDLDADGLYDLIYFDAFAPTVQPELWTPAILRYMYEVLNPEGILVTYCAKGQVRRDLQAAGFNVERLEGPPGKKHMTRAVKQSAGKNAPV